MIRNRPRLLTSLLLFVLSASFLSADDHLQVQLHSGRSFEGTLDERTDHAFVWIKYGTARSTIRRPIAWDQVSQIRMNGQLVPSHEVLAARPEPTRHVTHSKSRVLTLGPLQPESIAPGEQTQSKPRQDSPLPLIRPAFVRITHLQFDVSTANWDRDAADDGLLVRVYPQAANGRTVPSHGTLQVTLIARKRVRYHDAPRQRGVVPTVVRRWSIPLRRQDIGQPIRLPYGAVDPQRDDRISSYGDVHVSFGAPGHGVYQARQNYLRLRPWAISR